jgi:hypothetical protein
LLIVKIDYKLSLRLNELWHSRLPYFSSVRYASIFSHCFAAEYKNRYYAVAMWSIPQAWNRLRDGRSCLELRRMAIGPDAPKNTASRMLKIMKNIIKIERPDIIKLISYQDTEVHLGTIYKAAGWKQASRNKFLTKMGIRFKGGQQWTLTQKQFTML